MAAAAPRAIRTIRIKSFFMAGQHTATLARLQNAPHDICPTSLVETRHLVRRQGSARGSVHAAKVVKPQYPTTESLGPDFESCIR